MTVSWVRSTTVVTPISKTMQVKRTRHAGHYCRSKNQFISDVLWTPSHECPNVCQPERIYISSVWEPWMIGTDREGKSQGNLCSVNWLRWYIYIYIYICMYEYSAPINRSIYIIIIIIMLCHQNGYPWPFLTTPPYHSSLPAGPQGYTLYPHRAAVCRF